MAQTLIKNAAVMVDGHTINRWVRLADGKITDLGRNEPDELPGEQVIDAGGMRLLPGFVDVHVHGAVNYDTMDASPESLAAMARFYAAHGVTSFLATTWTDSHDNITRALENAKACLGPIEGGATLRGVHLEGPYLNPEKSGAQNTSHIRRATHEEALPWLNLDVIRLVSVAPEYEENHWFIRECAERNVTVSAAHTGATYEDIVAAVNMGLTHSTHTFNAMTGIHHRKPGVAGAVLTLPEINCELIADNIHVHPAIMRLIWNVKNFTGVILITDAVRAAGMPDGEYPVDERTVYVKDGVAQLEDGTLAGSTLTMDRGLRNFIAATRRPLEEVYEATSLNPAEAVGLDDVTGSIAVGKDADLVLLDDELNVCWTMAQGRMVYEAE